MLRARALPPACALKRMRLRSPPSNTTCKASSSALLPAPFGAMMALVASSVRVCASNRKNCTRCTRSSSCIVILRDAGFVRVVVGGIVVAVVLVQPLQPLLADHLDDGRAGAQVERLRVVALGLDRPAHTPALERADQRAQRADV